MCGIFGVVSLGTLLMPDAESLDLCVHIMAMEFGWDKGRTVQETHEAHNAYGVVA
jgi:hypothetical protein